jgi:hypothetical protein
MGIHSKCIHFEASAEDYDMSKVKVKQNGSLHDWVYKYALTEKVRADMDNEWASS